MLSPLTSSVTFNSFSPRLSNDPQFVFDTLSTHSQLTLDLFSTNYSIILQLLSIYSSKDQQMYSPKVSFLAYYRSTFESLYINNRFILVYSAYFYFNRAFFQIIHSIRIVSIFKTVFTINKFQVDARFSFVSLPVNILLSCFTLKNGSRVNLE